VRQADIGLDPPQVLAVQQRQLDRGGTPALASISTPST
jgi:hypothetical protein